MSSYVLTLSAEADLLEIWNFIAKDNPDAADRHEEKLFTNMDKLAKFPSLGHRRRDLTEKPYLFFPVGSYLIIYDPATKPLHIMRVLPGSRDVKTILKE